MTSEHSQTVNGACRSGRGQRPQLVCHSRRRSVTGLISPRCAPDAFVVHVQ